MRKSEVLLNYAKAQAEKAPALWKAKDKDGAAAAYKDAIYHLMRSYLVCTGIVHLDTMKSVYTQFDKVTQKDKAFSQNYSFELSYFYFYFEKIGYFEENREFTSSLRDYFDKLIKRLYLMGKKAIVSTDADQYPSPDDLIGFSTNINNLI